MPLTPGTRLGPYEVTAQIGVGGMGEVYRARDAKLGRDVALKILPDAFVGDPDRVARFEREAQVVAALNHPNIAIIHGFQESDGVRALVLELVEGETLTEVIARGPLPLPEALAIARQIADALEAAHDKGIVHRDLKPDNVKVTPNGTIKVLDFGLAKMLEPDVTRTPSYAGTMSPTISLHATYGGIILGTPAYMSPEQARGKPIDRRVDIWAFGCVLFELLCGKKTFDPGETISDAVAQILTREPDWSALPADTPPHVQTLLRRCLQKDPQKRLPHIGMVRLELDEGARPGVSSTTVRPKPNATSTARMLAVVVAIALAAVALGAGLTWLMMRTPSATARQTRFTIDLVRPISVNAFFRNIAISPDGTHLIYSSTSVAGQQQGELFVRRLDQLDTRPMRGIVSAGAPFFSPDSQSIGFFSNRTELMRVSIEGGAPIQLGSFQGAPRGATWGTNDTIVFATNDTTTGLLSVTAAGGDPQVLTRPDPKKGEQDHLFPSMLPGGRSVLFTIAPLGGLIENSLIAVLDLATGQTKTLLRGGSHAIYTSTGHIVYASGGNLMGARFDPDRLTVSSDPRPLVEQVMTMNSGAAQFDVSRTGTLVFIPKREDSGSTVGRLLVWVDRNGREQPIDLPRRAYTFPRLSPDGKRAALDIREQSGKGDIWIWDLERGTQTRLTTSSETDAWPVWTPDGAHIVFTSSRDGGAPNLYWQRADFTGVAERISTDDNPQNPNSISPDGQALILQVVNPNNAMDLSVLAMDTLLSGKPASGKIQAQRLLHTPAFEAAGEISPDGRWIAYYSNSSTRNEVYVRAFPNVESGGQLQISTAGGTRPAWSRNGRELFYLDANGAMTVVPVQTSPTFSAGKPRKLFDAAWWTGQSGRTYDVSADGQRFLAIKDPSSNAENAPAQTFTVVLNWVEELKQKLP